MTHLKKSNYVAQDIHVYCCNEAYEGVIPGVIRMIFWQELPYFH